MLEAYAQADWAEHNNYCFPPVSGRRGSARHNAGAVLACRELSMALRLAPTGELSRDSWCNSLRGLVCTALGLLLMAREGTITRLPRGDSVISALGVDLALRHEKRRAHEATIRVPRIPPGAVVGLEDCLARWHSAEADAFRAFI